MIATRKLHHYFQAHPIVVLTGQSLKQILQWLDTFRCLLKWSIELGEFHIDYWLRMDIKAQTLGNFIAEFTYDVALDPDIEIPKEWKVGDSDIDRWKPFVYGSSN